MTERRRITAAMSVRVFDGANGQCHICGMPIFVGDLWDVEHVKPLWLGGEDGEANMAPAHKRCHREKSAGESPVRAKGTRVRARHIGAKKARRQFTGWRRFDGTPVRNARQGK